VLGGYRLPVSASVFIAAERNQAALMMGAVTMGAVTMGAVTMGAARGTLAFFS
jgi:hypothetical protein